jgi:hypothetical protein
VVRNILRKGGRGLHAFFFVIFVIRNFSTKQNMSSNQVKGKIIKQASEWDDRIILTWVYEGVDVIYFLKPRKRII